MIATCTYLLSEQAQRAQMAATGQPVARTQTMTIEVTPDDLPLCEVATDGSLSIDTAHRHTSALRCAGWEDGNPIRSTVPAPDVVADIRRGQAILGAAYVYACGVASQYVLDTPALMMEPPEQAYRVEVHKNKFGGEILALEIHPRVERKWFTYGIYASDLSREAQLALVERYQADVGRRDAESSTAVDAWLADPALRLHPTYNGAEIQLSRVVVTKPRYAELYAEVQRRNDIDEADQAAKEAAIEAAKVAAIDACVAACGDALLIQQHADGLLSRKTIVSMMANVSLDAAGLPGECPDSVVCDDRQCPCGDDVVECLPQSQYAAWHPITAGLPEGYTVEFRRVRNCRGLDNWQQNDERAEEVEYHAVVTIPAGPFQFTRRIKL